MTPIWYVLVKLIAYAAWSAVGIKLLRTAVSSPGGPPGQGDVAGQKSQWLAAIGFGLLRLFMGVFFGLFIWLLSSMLAENMRSFASRDVFIYLLVYVPVRWIEWTILAWLIARRFRKVSWIFRWSDVASRWRLGGIVISCLADIPLMISLGGIIPTGRFLC